MHSRELSHRGRDEVLDSRMASEDSIESLVLRRHAEIFVQCSDCTPILGVLRANNVINEVELDISASKLNKLLSKKTGVY